MKPIVRLVWTRILVSRIRSTFHIFSLSSLVMAGAQRGFLGLSPQRRSPKLLSPLIPSAMELNLLSGDTAIARNSMLILFYWMARFFSPKSAMIYGPTGGSVTNFHELNSVYPSALPSQELDLLANSFVETLLKLGITNGVMHLEGRAENSSVDCRDRNGIVGLQPHDPKAPTQDLSA